MTCERLQSQAARNLTVLRILEGIGKENLFRSFGNLVSLLTGLEPALDFVRTSDIAFEIIENEFLGQANTYE